MLRFARASRSPPSRSYTVHHRGRQAPTLAAPGGGLLSRDPCCRDGEIRPASGRGLPGWTTHAVHVEDRLFLAPYPGTTVSAAIPGVEAMCAAISRRVGARHRTTDEAPRADPVHHMLPWPDRSHPAAAPRALAPCRPAGCRPLLLIGPPPAGMHASIVRAPTRPREIRGCTGDRGPWSDVGQSARQSRSRDMLRAVGHR